MKHAVLTLAVLFLFASAYCQKEMTYPEYQASVTDVQKREQTAKEKIAEEQGKIETVKEQIKVTKKSQEKAHGEIYSTANTTPEAVEQWGSQVNALLTQVESFIALPAQDRITRQAEVAGFEAQAATLKADHAALLTSSAAQMSVVEGAITKAKASIVQAQQDVVGSAAAAKQAALDEKKRKIEEAKAAKEEAKRKAEEERQAKIDAKKQAQEEAKQKADEEKQAKLEAKKQAQEESQKTAEEARAAREKATVAADGEEVKPGTIHRVKDMPDDRESLSKLALRAYGDVKLWTKIYEANKAKIDAAFERAKKSSPALKNKGPQDLIYPGQDLVIPQ
jgi:nucleoid-associated protein YgaU